MDQDNIDMLDFEIIEERVFDWQRRQKNKPKPPNMPRGQRNMKSVTIPLKDL